MKNNNYFSRNLIKYRKLKGLSQRDLANKVGISQRMINYYENNPTSIQIEKIKLLADSLDCKISDLFNENDSLSILNNLDIRWIKKIQELKELSETDRKEINNHINSLLEKSKLKKEKQILAAHS